MNNTMKKEIYLVVALNEIAWYGKDDTKERLKMLPLSYQYTIRKNMKPLARMVEDFNSFKTEQENILRDNWFDEEHSNETTVKDENGNDVPGRKVKDEYLAEYDGEIKKMNSQLEKLLLEMEEITYTPINIDDLVEAAGNNSITIDDLDMISLFEVTQENE